ncbi:MAG: hypothetical protein LBD81_00070 [Holosporaceae bacterium]|jgi:hypothetical protein|nr:hypothetical protein [Holosporaceae bacterium]
MQKLSRYSKIAELFLVLAGLIASAVCYLRTHCFAQLFGDLKLRFLDTDDYMRLVRVRDFFIHHDLGKTIIDRANVPYGGDLHWTRFYDLFFIIPSYILNFFLNSIEQSIEYVGFFITPVIKIVTIGILFRLFQKMTDIKSAFVATLIFAVHPAINHINMFGRPDHHAFILLFTVIYLYNLAEMAESEFKSVNAAASAGLTGALCIWISPETLMILLPAEAAILFLLYGNAEKLTSVYIKNVVTSCCVGIIVFLFCNFDRVDLLCFGSLLSISYITFKKFHWSQLPLLLLLAFAFSTLPQLEYDKISPVHLSLYLCLSVCLGVCIAKQDIIAKYGRYFVAVDACVVGGIFLCMFPLFVYGMEAHVSEELKTVWLHSNVDELKSPFDFGKWPAVFFCICLVIFSVAAHNKIRDLMEEVFSDRNILWWIFVVSCSCYLLLASIADRLRATLVFLSIPLVVDMTINGVVLKYWPCIMRGLAAFVLLVAPDLIQKYQPLLQSYFTNREDFENFCKMRLEAYQQEDRFFKFLDSISEKPITILTYLGKSSMTLYYTKHKVVSIPYHRQEHGILLFHLIAETEYNERVVKKILNTTGTDYIFISKSMCLMNPSSRNSLAEMIAESRPPDWISIAAIPTEFEDVVLAKIDKKKLAASIPS